MHKFAVSFCVSGGDTNGKGAIMVGSINNPGPTFNSGEDGVFSTIVLIVGTTLECVFVPCGSMVVMVGIVDVFVTSECILLCILCIVTQCFDREFL